MTRWNPNDPAVIGPEFLAGYDSSITANRFAPVVQRFRSTAAETIANLRLHHDVISVGGPAAYLAEIHAQGSEVDDGAFTTVTYAPNVLTNVVGPVTDEAGGAAVVADFATWPPYYNTTDVRMGTGASLDLEFASAGLAATGRIAAVALEILTLWGVYPLGNGPDYKRRTVVSLVNGGVLYGTQARIIPNNVPSGEGGCYFYTWGEINPITGQPWTQADIQAFDTATTRIRLARQAGDTGTWISPAVRLVVAYETTERRLARGAFSATPRSAVWSPTDIALASPAGAANWAKANATDYALVVRQADQGNLTPFFGDILHLTTVHAVAGQEPPADLPSYTGSVVTATFVTDFTATLISQSMTAAALVPGRVIPFVLRTTAPATSADGQPYTQVRTPGILAGSGSTQQELRSTGSDDYAGLRVTAGWFPSPPTEDLVVEVRRRSDSVLMGTFTITPDLVSGAANGQLVVVEVKAPAPGLALAAGVQYYLDFSSATPSGKAWIVGLLAVQGGAGGVTYQEATYSGGTDQADPINGVASTALTYAPADFAAVLDAAVDGPTGLLVTDASQALPGPLPDGCAMTGLPYAAIEWVATALGGDFAGYRLQREHPVLGWQDIAYITTEAVESYMDEEGRLGVEECYRIRAERTDGATSYWSDPVVCVTVPTAGCGYTFSSNELPAAGVGYADTYDGDARRGYDFPEAREVQYRTMYGRDFQVAFRPLTRRGVTFGRRLLVATLGAAAGPGPAALDALRDLAWATTSYICVRDEAGNRWFGSVTVPSGTVQQPSGIHWAEIEFVETTSTPSTPDAVPC